MPKLDVDYRKYFASRVFLKPQDWKILFGVLGEGVAKLIWVVESVFFSFKYSNLWAIWECANTMMLLAPFLFFAQFLHKLS